MNLSESTIAGRQLTEYLDSVDHGETFSAFTYAFIEEAPAAALDEIRYAIVDPLSADDPEVDRVLALTHEQVRDLAFDLIEEWDERVVGYIERQWAAGLH